MPFNSDRLIQLRVKSGLTQYKLSLETNIDYTYLHLLEKGARKNPSFDIVEKLANFFKVNMETFCKGTVL